MSYNEFMQTVAQQYDDGGGNLMKKWRFGNPIPTYALALNIDEQMEPCPYQVTQRPSLDHVSEFTWHIHMDASDYIYGLGQNLGGMNKRGRRYISYCTDDPHHTEDKETLYAAHNVIYMINKSREVQVMYWDTPSKVTFDCGFSDAFTLTVTAEGQGVDFYICQTKDLNSAIKTFRRLIGKSYVPPKWAFGYFQSRWGYASESDIKEVQQGFKDHHIPLEGIYVDIDYMERFKDFTVDQSKYPDFKGLVEDFKKCGQYLVPIIDAGVKIEPGYMLYEEGIKDGHFVMNPNGEPYVAAVWPGRVHFPDFMQERTQTWFGDWYRFLIDMGIEGIWNDMNEPAIFYDEEALEAAIEKAIASKGQNLDIYSYFELGDAFRQLSNQRAYYRRMQHQYKGETFNNDTLHNLYGYFMTKSADLGFKNHLGDKRPLILSRASSIGMHRHGGIWTGDNSSWWSHLQLNVKQMPALSAVGFLYSGADTGGFGGHASGELLSRWLQFSAFTPLLRNHAALGTRNQEPYMFGTRDLAINRQLIQIRYRLMPFLYSEFIKAYHQDTPLFSPLHAYFSDARCLEIEDQIMLGDGVMLIPVVEPNRTGRMVYLPEPMTLVTLGATGARVEDFSSGDVFIPYPLEGLQFFITLGHAIPIVPPANTTSTLSVERVTWLGSMTLANAYGHAGIAYSWYDDDGQTRSSLNMPAQICRYTIITSDPDFALAESREGIHGGTWHPKDSTKHDFSALI